MDEYLEHFTLFHDQKHKFLSGNEEFMKCSGSDSIKKFTEGKTLILSCGASDASKYGIQFKVTLPNYVKRDSEIIDLKQKLMKGLDSKGFNFNILHKYDLISNLKENQEFVDEINKGIDIINEEYNKTNLGGKSEKIKEFYENRINLTKDLRQVENRINLELWSNESELKELRQNYVGIVNQINSEFNDIQKFLQSVNPYIMIEQPKVEIVNKDYKENLLNHKKKKQKKKDLPIKKSPNSKCQDLMCENEIYEGENAEKDFKKWARRNHPDKKHGKDSNEKKEIHAKFAEMNDCAQKSIFCPESKRNEPKKSSVKKEPSVEKPKKSSVKEPQPEKKEVTINDFKEGMKVQWKVGGKTLKGVVNKINKKKKKKIEILQEDGDIKDIDITKLKILK